MAAPALDRWRGERAEQLDQLADAHRSAQEQRRLQPSAVTELDSAMLLRLAAQFQGFVKDLHEDTAVAFVALLQPPSDAIEHLVTSGLQANRELDRGNAREASIRQDFARFGIRIWEAMEAADARTARCRLDLRWLNFARNALAHDDGIKLKRLYAAGYKVETTTIRQWRRSLDLLAVNMTQAVASYLSSLFDTTPPWQVNDENLSQR